jgi:hypothetical protein
MRRIPLAAAAVLALTFFATTAVAQETEAQEACHASFSPATIPAGQAAVEVTADLSSAIGVVSAIKAPEESGVAKASMADLEVATMASPADDGQKETIEMAAEGNQAEVWLTTVNATAGTYEVELTGDDGSCRGEITIEAQEGTGTPESDEAGQSN